MRYGIIREVSDARFLEHGLRVHPEHGSRVGPAGSKPKRRPIDQPRLNADGVEELPLLLRHSVYPGRVMVVSGAIGSRWSCVRYRCQADRATVETDDRAWQNHFLSGREEQVVRARRQAKPTDDDGRSQRVDLLRHLQGSGHVSAGAGHHEDVRCFRICRNQCSQHRLTRLTDDADQRRSVRSEDTQCRSICPAVSRVCNGLSKRSVINLDGMGSGVIGCRLERLPASEDEQPRETERQGHLQCRPTSAAHRQSPRSECRPERPIAAIDGSERGRSMEPVAGRALSALSLDDASSALRNRILSRHDQSILVPRQPLCSVSGRNTLSAAVPRASVAISTPVRPG